MRPSQICSLLTKIRAPLGNSHFAVKNSRQNTSAKIQLLLLRCPGRRRSFSKQQQRSAAKQVSFLKTAVLPTLTIFKILRLWDVNHGHLSANHGAAQVRISLGLPIV